MIVSINQPAYLPWLGYFHRIAASDVHVVLDHVQFEKNGFTNRNRIRTAEGSAWLTVPVRTKGRFGALPINALEIDNSSPWRERHRKSLWQHYHRAPHFADHESWLQATYTADWPLLFPLCRSMTEYLLGAFGIRTPVLYSSQMEVTQTKDLMVLEVCRRVGARTYLSGALGRQYLREPLFADAGIAVRYQDYRSPEYRQRYPGFVPQLTALDLLLNCGPASLDILMQGQAADLRQGSAGQDRLRQGFGGQVNS
jgi:hypothetical protein